jgi:hypothetical protein
MSCILAATHHDPEGRLTAQFVRVLPILREAFSNIAVLATDTTDAASLARIEGAEILVRQTPPVGHVLLGRARRRAVQAGLELAGDQLLFCDLDRMLHWAEYHPDELLATVVALPQYDCTVLGRTDRAFASHPRTQRDTEAIVNSVFAQVSGKPWDVTAAARGLSRRAALAILAGCPEESVGTDTVWPLFLMQSGAFKVGYRATEGMEFETPDRFGDQVATLGSVQAWVDRLDGDAHEWVLRLEIARSEVAAML